MEDQRDILKNDRPFSYIKVKGDKALVRWYGRQIMILTGGPYRRLNALEDRGASEHEIQLFLARVTGHFKHGNERR